MHSVGGTGRPGPRFAIRSQHGRCDTRQHESVSEIVENGLQGARGGLGKRTGWHLGKVSKGVGRVGRRRQRAAGSHQESDDESHKGRCTSSVQHGSILHSPTQTPAGRVWFQPLWALNHPHPAVPTALPTSPTSWGGESWLLQVVAELL